jgi:hypothetical protein
LITSFPPSPAITSAAFVPVSASLASVPVTVAALPAQLCCVGPPPGVVQRVSVGVMLFGLGLAPTRLKSAAALSVSSAESSAVAQFAPMFRCSASSPVGMLLPFGVVWSGRLLAPVKLAPPQDTQSIGIPS